MGAPSSRRETEGFLKELVCVCRLCGGGGQRQVEEGVGRKRLRDGRAQRCPWASGSAVWLHVRAEEGRHVQESPGQIPQLCGGPLWT